MRLRGYKRLRKWPKTAARQPYSSLVIVAAMARTARVRNWVASLAALASTAHVDQKKRLQDAAGIEPPNSSMSTHRLIHSATWRTLSDRHPFGLNIPQPQSAYKVTTEC